MPAVYLMVIYVCESSIIPFFFINGGKMLQIHVPYENLTGYSYSGSVVHYGKNSCIFATALLTKKGFTMFGVLTSFFVKSFKQSFC